MPYVLSGVNNKQLVKFSVSDHGLFVGSFWDYWLRLFWDILQDKPKYNQDDFISFE